MNMKWRNIDMGNVDEMTRSVFCSTCIVQANCSDTCDEYDEIWQNVYPKMKEIEEKWGRRLTVEEVKALAVGIAKEEYERTFNEVEK